MAAFGLGINMLITSIVLNLNLLFLNNNWAISHRNLSWHFFDGLILARIQWSSWYFILSCLVAMIFTAAEIIIFID